MNFHAYLEKLRALPEKQKRIILWTVVAVLAVAMAIFWFNSAKKRLSQMGESLKAIELPQIETPAPQGAE